MAAKAERATQSSRRLILFMRTYYVVRTIAVTSNLF
jgi:hypothetical protein